MTTPVLLGERVAVLTRDVGDHERRIELVEGQTDMLASRMDVLATKVGIYAALGSAVGGGALAVVSGVVVWLATH